MAGIEDQKMSCFRSGIDLHCEKYFTITNQKYSYSTQQQMVLLKFSNSGMLK